MAPKLLAVQRAAEVQGLPPANKPHSVTVPGTATETRTATYRHWRFPDGPLETLDERVSWSGRTLDHHLLIAM